MAITASRTSLGRDLETGREAAASRGNASLIRKGLRQAKKDKDYDKALRFNAALASEGKAYGMTGSADDTSSIAQGRVASREALSNQMRGQLSALTGQTREGNIAAAKAAGTFDATRQKFNAANTGKKVMDEAGNIMDAPATPAPAAPAARNASKGLGSSAAPAATPTAAPAPATPRASLTDQLINGASQKPVSSPMRPPEPAAPATSEAPKRKGVIMDNGVDVSEDIRRGLAGDRTGAFYTGGKAAPASGPDMNDPLIKSAKALENASKGVTAAQASSDKAAQSLKMMPKASPAAAAAAAASEATMSPEGRMKIINDAVSSLKTPAGKATTPTPTTRDVDPMLTDKRGFGSPDKNNPANYDYKANPAASELPYIAGRGSDAASRLTEAFNPLTMFQTLKQGGKSALPPMMGEQPEYANANDRLKGDADAIKAAEAAGQIKARRVEDQYGKTNIEVLTPTMRETGERVRPELKKPIAARAKGGPVKAGKPYLVGEEGPEIVVPDEDGEVLPNEKLRKKSRKELQKMLSKR